jgi:hypothetical protein
MMQIMKASYYLFKYIYIYIYIYVYIYIYIKQVFCKNKTAPHPFAARLPHSNINAHMNAVLPITRVRLPEVTFSHLSLVNALKLAVSEIIHSHHLCTSPTPCSTPL